MEKVIRDGKVAVLYSPGFGAGWYTWNQEVPECLFDPEIVALVEAGKNSEAGDLAEKKYNTETRYFYSGGASDLVVTWLPVGTLFEVTEYDGSESIDLKDRMGWIEA